MNNGNIELIENAFENIENINSSSPSDIIKAIDSTIEDIDTGNLRVAEKINNNWVINQWVKKAILLYFRINDMKLINDDSLVLICGTYNSFIDDGAYKNLIC